MDLAYAIGGGVAIVVLVVLLARARSRAEGKDRRGTEPGEGDVLIDGGYHAGGLGGGHSSITRIPRDPQKYAKGFVPDGKRRPRERPRAASDDDDKAADETG